MKLPRGKGWYIWQILGCERGDFAQIAKVAKAAGIGHVLVKIANGILPYNVSKGQDLVPPLVAALRNAGISVWGWHSIYGDSPIAEAGVAIGRMERLKLDGYVIDAEAEYKQPGKATAAKQFMTALRAGLPGVPIGLSSYRYPSYHPQLPWREFRDQCDFDMPQVYWLKSTNAAAQLTRSWTEFRKFSKKLPYIPTGAAFKEWSWVPTVGQVEEFLKAAEQMDLPAVNFWSWDNCRANLPKVWDAIGQYSWFGPPVTQPEPGPEPPVFTPFQRFRCIKQVRIRSYPNTADSGNIVGALNPGEGDDSQDALYALDQRQIGEDVWIRIGWKQWTARRYSGTTFLEKV